MNKNTTKITGSLFYSLLFPPFLFFPILSFPLSSPFLLFHFLCSAFLTSPLVFLSPLLLLLTSLLHSSPFLSSAFHTLPLFSCFLSLYSFIFFFPLHLFPLSSFPFFPSLSALLSTPRVLSLPLLFYYIMVSFYFLSFSLISFTLFLSPLIFTTFFHPAPLSSFLLPIFPFLCFPHFSFFSFSSPPASPFWSLLPSPAESPLLFRSHPTPLVLNYTRCGASLFRRLIDFRPHRNPAVVFVYLL